MDDIHLSREVLRAVDQGKLPRSFLEEIKTEHLLSRCPHCRSEVEAYEIERQASTGSVLTRTLQIVLSLLRRFFTRSSQELARAEQDLQELLRLSSPGERAHRIERARNRFRSPALVRLLIEMSKQRVSSQPMEAFHFADLARTIANLNPRMHGFFDLYVLATVQMANACRVGNDRRKSDDLFALARQVIAEHGVTDPEVIAQVDDLQGSLRKDQRRLSEAERLFRRAAMLFDLLSAKEDAARVLINLAAVFSHQNNLNQAIETTRAALDLLHPEADPKLLVAGHYNLTLQLVPGPGGALRGGVRAVGG